jgi:predicted MFS family arabinose efflux permease
MTHEKPAKFFVLFSLYIAQSVPMSFFSTVVPVIMRQEHYSLQSIGLLQLIKLPWILKFLWAPLIDRQTENLQQFRKWIYGSELFYAVIILSIGFLNLQFDFRLIIILMIIAFFASATQDIATDAYAILIMRKEERSFGNSMQSSGTFIGTLIGSGFLLIIYHYFGWQLLLFSLAIFALIALIPLIYYKKWEPVIVKKGSIIKMKDIYLFFTVPGMVNRIFLLVFCYSGIVGILAMLKPFLVDLGYSVKEIGFMSGILGTSVAALASFAAAFLINKVGRRKSLVSFSFFGLVASFYLWIISLGAPSTPLIYLGIIMLWGAYGLLTVAIYTTSMDHVRPGREGTDFTLQIVITHLSSLIISVISGKIADTVSYSGLFLIETLLGTGTFLALFFLYRKKKSAPVVQK